MTDRARVLDHKRRRSPAAAETRYGLTDAIPDGIAAPE